MKNTEIKNKINELIEHCKDEELLIIILRLLQKC